jgi:hypothetical protein
MSQVSVPSGGLWADIKSGMGNLGYWLGGVSTPAIRLGVTGLSRAGKTVFITSLVHALVSGARLPAFRPRAEERIAEARLVAHPDDGLPRFGYEDHLAVLTGPDRDWPQSTRQISALSIALRYQSRQSWLGGLLGPAGMLSGGESQLRLDIVDYPGEWLLDLPLLAKSYADWSAETLAKAGQGRREAPFAPYRALLAGDLPGEGEDGQAQALAKAFTAALRACREDGRGLSALAPGRFLMPGDLEGAPALTFAPLPPDFGDGALRASMDRRYEAYKARVVRPFFADHFSRLDRQIVLVDVLGAINGGEEAVADLEHALADVLAAFNAGANSLLTSLFAPRVSRILFAATKADHLHHTNHDRLEAILALLVRRAWHRAQAAGAATATVALAGIRATREVTARVGGEELPCIAGIPLAGERLDGRVFDGKAEVALFPGDLPAEPEAVLTGNAGQLRFLRFRPPVIAPGKQAVLPSIRLDRALDFLIGDLIA